MGKTFHRSAKRDFDDEKNHAKDAKKHGHKNKYKVRGDAPNEEVDLEALKGLPVSRILHLEDDDV